MKCPECQADLSIGDWPFCPHGSVFTHHPAVNERERAIKYYHPDYGYRTPGRADQPMPERLRRLGFRTVEFPSIRSLESHAKQTGSRAEVLDHNRNSHLAERQYNV